jgi:hypothetical protein
MIVNLRNELLEMNQANFLDKKHNSNEKQSQELNAKIDTKSDFLSANKSSRSLNSCVNIIRENNRKKLKMFTDQSRNKKNKNNNKFKCLSVYEIYDDKILGRIAAVTLDDKNIPEIHNKKRVLFLYKFKLDSLEQRISNRVK